MFVDAASPLTGSLLVHVQLDGPADAPPLVLLHSLGTQAAVWEPQAEALAATTRVIRPDMRGHGLTEVTPGPYTIDGLAADTLATLDALGIHSFHLAGISIGGLIAQAIAARAPARIRALVVILVTPPKVEGRWHSRVVSRTRAAVERLRGRRAPRGRGDLEGEQAAHAEELSECAAA